MTTHEPVDLAWVAGLFEGEGTFGAYASDGRLQLAASVSMTDEDVITTLADVIGFGTVSTYRPSARTKDMFKWRCSSGEAVQFAGLILPWLHSRRRRVIREQYDKWYAHRTERGLSTPVFPDPMERLSVTGVDVVTA